MRVTSERQTLEDDVNRLRKQVSLATFTSDGRVVDPITESEVRPHTVLFVFFLYICMNEI